MSNIFDTNAKLNEAKEKLVSDFTSKITFNTLCSDIEVDEVVDRRKALADEFRRSSEFSKACDEVKSKATIIPNHNSEYTKVVRFDATYYACLAPEEHDSPLREEENGSITERWHLYKHLSHIGVLNPSDTDFTNEDEVLTNLTNLVALSKLRNSLGLRSGYLTYSDLEM